MFERTATIARGTTKIRIGSKDPLSFTVGAKIPKQIAPKAVKTTRSG